MARYADIAVNLTDPMFQGIYHGKKRHAPDLEAVINRAKAQGVERILITGTSLSESRAALEMAKRYGRSILGLKLIFRSTLYSWSTPYFYV